MCGVFGQMSSVLNLELEKFRSKYNRNNPTGSNQNQAFSKGLLVCSGLTFDHRFLVKIDARARKTSLTTVNWND